MIKDCIGCSLNDPKYYPVCFLYEAIPDYEIQNKCPCIKCIVKATCTEICITREKFFQKFEMKYCKQINKARFKFDNTEYIRDVTL